VNVHKLTMYKVTVNGKTARCLAVGRRQAALKVGAAYRVQHGLPTSHAVIPTVEEVRPVLSW